LLGKFKELVGSPWKRQPPAAEPAALDQLEIIGPKSQFSAVDVLKDRLADIADDNDGLLTGVLQPLSLDDVRDALGSQWPALSGQVLASASRHIDYLLGPGDSARRHGETGFLVRFAGVGKEAGALRAARLALRLKAALFGQFPQLSGSDNEPPPSDAPASKLAHEVMKSQFEVFAERRRQARAEAVATDPRLCRSALGQAVCDLLDAGTPITAVALIGQLQTRRGTNDLILKAASIEVAIARLEQLLAAEAEPETPALAVGAN
jgi:hypothetical protein